MKIPIKQTLYVVTTALVMGSSVQSVYAADPIPSQNITPSDKMDYDWTLVQEMNGVSIYFALVEIGTERFLTVKFDNTTDEAVDCTWSMTKNNETIIITEDGMFEAILRLDANGSSIHDGTFLIELSEGDQFSNFTVYIHPTKH